MAVTTDNPAGFSLSSLMQSANARLLLMMGGAAAIVALMAAQYTRQPGNYLAFFSSFTVR